MSNLIRVPLGSWLITRDDCLDEPTFFVIELILGVYVIGIRSQMAVSFVETSDKGIRSFVSEKVAWEEVDKIRKAIGR